MKTCQRLLYKSLIFFSIIFITFILLIETNIGFKWIFNISNHFFMKLKVEKISGNWRNFLLKNIQYDIFGYSIKADSIHVMLDITSLFNTSQVVKDIKIKNLMVLLNNNISNNLSNKKISNNISNQNIFIKYPIIIKKIHIDKLFFQSSQINILFLNILTGVKLFNNHILFLPTYINKVNLILPNPPSSGIVLKDNTLIKQFNLIKILNYVKKICSFLKYISNTTPIYMPLDINFQYLQCKKIKFFNNQNNNLFQIKLQATIKENILNIQTIKIDSDIVKMKSFGKISFRHDSSMSSIINNEIIIPKLNNKIINILFKSSFNKNFVFTLQSRSLYKFKIRGSIFFDKINYPFSLKLDSQNLLWPLNNQYFLNFINFHTFIKGQINDYFLYFKNIFILKEFPSMLFNIEGQGTLKNIFLKKIKLCPIHKDQIYKKMKANIDNTEYNEHILKLIGKMNILTHVHNNIRNLYIPKMDFNLNFMKKKLAILGSLYYQNNNVLTIPRINLSIGKNKLFLRGFVGKKYNFNSSIDANNLDYFFPNLKGNIKAEAKLHGNHMISLFTSKILATNLYADNMYIKSMNLFTEINAKEIFSGNILLDINKIGFRDTYINRLRIKNYFHNYEQKFDVLLKSKNFYINFKINGSFNTKTRVWHGLFKKINIKTCLGKFNFKNKFSIDYYHNNYTIDNLYQNSMKKKDMLSSIVYNKPLDFLNILNKSFTNFRSNLFIQGSFKGFLGNSISHGKIFLKGSNIKLEKNRNKKIFSEKIDFLKISINLINDNLKTEWIVKKIQELSKDEMILGYLNIQNIYNTKNINGQCHFFNFPMSFLNFFTANTNEINGIFTSKIKFFGTLDQPKISSDVKIKAVYIKSNNILKYISLFFPYLPKKINTIKINQTIMIKTGEILFQLYSSLKDNHSKIEWSLIFKSKNISMLVLPKIQVDFSSHLKLHYLFSRYDLIGFINLPFFCFKINEKNFIF